MVKEMLYQDRNLGRTGLFQRLAARLAIAFGARRGADLDLQGLNAHLRRDLGLDEIYGSRR